MGVDWLRKSEEGFKHRLQEAAGGMKPTPLFTPEEEETMTYACHWLHEDETLPVGTRLTIFQRGDLARIAVMHGSKAVAEVRGEAVSDLRKLFKTHAELQDMLPVVIVRVAGPTEPFYVQAAIARRRRAKAV